MAYRIPLLLFVLFCSVSPIGAAQTSGTADLAQAPVVSSVLLQPALRTVRGTLQSLRFDKWKKGTVRDEASSHAASILRDLDTNLPPLIAGADLAPGSASKAIPLVKHLDAVYDVLLRVEEASRVSAPPEQVAALQQALDALEKARIALDDRLEQVSAAQEKQITQLQAALQARSAESPKTDANAAAKPCEPAKPAQKTKRVPAKKKAPATTPNATTNQKTTPQ